MIKQRHTRHNYHNRHNRGAALITALLITAVAAAIAAVIAVQESIAIRQTQLTTNAQQAYYDAQGIVDWAAELLVLDLNKQIQQQPALSFPQPLKLDSKFYGAEVQGEIDDANALFNINALMNGNIQPQFVRLLQAVAPTITANEAYTIANNISNWLRPSNADELYLRYNPPYRASHTRMAQISELRLVAGINQDLFLQLAPYITALPNANNSINILNAPLPVLMSLGDGITIDQARAIQTCQRNARGNAKAQQILQNCLAKLPIQFDQTINIVFSSNFFLVTAYVKLNQQWLQLKTLLKREYTNHNDQQANGQTTKIKISVHPIWQSFE